MEDFHGGECGGHLFRKSTVNKILRAGYYWPTLFADFFSTPQVVLEVEHEVGGPSHQHERHLTATMPVYITYQKGSRPLFTVAKRVLSPIGVEGALLPTSASEEQGRGKEPVHDEGPSGEPSDERETEFVLLHDDETYTKPTHAELKEVIQE